MTKRIVYSIYIEREKQKSVKQNKYLPTMALEVTGPLCHQNEDRVQDHTYQDIRINLQYQALSKFSLIDHSYHDHEKKVLYERSFLQAYNLKTTYLMNSHILANLLVTRDPWSIWKLHVHYIPDLFNTIQHNKNQVRIDISQSISLSLHDALYHIHIYVSIHTYQDDKTPPSPNRLTSILFFHGQS